MKSTPGSASTLGISLVVADPGSPVLEELSQPLYKLCLSKDTNLDLWVFIIQLLFLDGFDPTS